MTLENGWLRNRPEAYNDVTMAWEALRQPSTGGGGPGGSTQVSVSGLTFDSSNALIVNAGSAGPGGSTTVNVSSVSGIVTQRPSDTNWASSAGFHFDGSGNLNIAGSFSASTTVNVSSLAGAVIVRSSAADFKASVYQSTAADLNVTVAGYVAPSTTVNVSSLSGPVIVRSSAANLLASVYQSTAADLNVTVAGYVAPSTIIAVSTVGGIVAVRPSDTNWASSAGFHFDGSGNLNIAGTFSASTTVNVSSLAGAVITRSSKADALVTVYQSTAADLLATVTPAAGSTWPVRPLQSSQADLRTTVYQSTATDLNVTVGNISTEVTINGAVIVRSSKADALITAYQSTASDLKVAAQLFDSTNNALESSTRAAGLVNSTRRGLAVRSLMPECTVVTGFSSASGDLTLLAAAANQTVFVYAVTVLQYSSVLNTIRLLSGSTTQIFEISRSGINGGGTGSTGAPVLQPFVAAVSPPAYLCRASGGASTGSLVLGRTSSGHFSYNVSCWLE